jgi:hypothetical protein
LVLLFLVSTVPQAQILIALNPSMSLSFSTYLGGSLMDSVRDAAVDSQGNVYVTGGTESTNFPTTAGAYDRTFNGWHDVFVAKFSPSGNLIWSTLIGGPNYDRAYEINLDSQGFIYLAGRAGPGYPTTSGALQPTFGGDVVAGAAYGQQDGFITKLSPDGSSIVWSTFFGGDDGGIVRDMEIDGSGNIYVGMNSVSRPFPHITPGAYQTIFKGGGNDGVVAKISSSGSQVLWATYLGGSGNDLSTSIQVDSAGTVYVAGLTGSSDFPTTVGAYDRTFNGGAIDAYAAKLAPDGASLIYGTYLGGSADDESGGKNNLVIDGQGNAYVTGYTLSSNFPTTAGAYDTSHNGGMDLFVSKLSPNGSQLLASTFVGGGSSESDEGIEIGMDDNLYISGRTSSSNFPTTANAYQTILRGAFDGFFIKLSTDLSRLNYSTYMGGTSTNTGGGAGGEGFRAIAIDANGNAYLGGWTDSSDWPTFNAFQTALGGNWDAFLVKFIPPPQDTTPPAPPKGLMVR